MEKLPIAAVFWTIAIWLGSTLQYAQNQFFSRQVQFSLAIISLCIYLFCMARESKVYSPGIGNRDWKRLSSFREILAALQVVSLVVVSESQARWGYAVVPILTLLGFEAWRLQTLFKKVRGK